MIWVGYIAFRQDTSARLNEMPLLPSCGDARTLRQILQPATPPVVSSPPPNPARHRERKTRIRA